MANSIVPFESIANELSVRSDGVAKSTIRGAARICGVSEKALRLTFKGAELKPSKLAQTLMNAGFEPAELERFNEEGIPDQALAIIIEYYAFDAGRYETDQAKVSYRAFASVGIRATVWKVKNFEPGSPTQIRSVPSRDEAIADMKFMEAAADMLISAGLDPLLAKAHVLSQTARMYPALAPQIEAVKALIPQSSELQSDNIYLTPTDLGKRLNPPLSPQRINLLLIGLGLQSRTGKKDPAYELTSQGKKYGKVTLNQAKASDKTVQHIKWLASVIELFPETA